jgi:DNA excision repair protein ERCC-6
VCSKLCRDSEQTGDAAEGNLLRDLFEGTSVMSALDHAKIEGANEPSARAVEAEAARVARRAAEALRRSRLAVQVVIFRRSSCRQSVARCIDCAC